MHTKISSEVLNVLNHKMLPISYSNFCSYKKDMGWNERDKNSTGMLPMDNGDV